MALTAKQQRFVEEYLVDMNATQASIRAGYSAKTADKQGSQLLGKTRIAAAIASAQAIRSKRTEITQDRVLMELGRLGLYDIRKAVRWGSAPIAGADGELVYPVELVASEDMDDETAAAVSEVSLTAQGVKIKMADKLGALEKLGKHLGMFSGDAPPITINQVFDGWHIERAKPNPPESD